MSPAGGGTGSDKKKFQMGVDYTTPKKASCAMSPEIGVCPNICWKDGSYFNFIKTDRGGLEALPLLMPSLIYLIFFF